jgi:hypothetical protein
MLLKVTGTETGDARCGNIENPINKDGLKMERFWSDHASYLCFRAYPPLPMPTYPLLNIRKPNSPKRHFLKGSDLKRLPQASAASLSHPSGCSERRPPMTWLISA